MKKPPAQHNAAVSMARRGPPSSTQRPNTAEETPRKKIASENIQPSSVSFQSPGADLLMPMSLVIGRLKTLNAYAWPMHRCTQSAAGGTIQRLKPGLAIVRSRSRNDSRLMVHPPLNVEALFLAKTEKRAWLPSLSRPGALSAQCGWAFCKSINRLLSCNRI